MDATACHTGACEPPASGGSNEVNYELDIVLLALVLLLSGGLSAEEVSTFRAYVDSDLCARIMLGPITPARIECSQSTVKDGSEPVLVQLRNNLVLSVNKQKMIRPLAGQLAEVSGEVKAKNGTAKLQSANPITAESVPQGDPARKLLDVRTYRTDRSAQLHEKIRHELAMMPYISEFDFISFTQNGPDVILTGWTIRSHQPEHRLQRRQGHPGCGIGRQQY